MRSSFSSSRLVRLLGVATPVATPAGGMDFAERLSTWVSAFDAIRLQSAQQTIRTLEVTPRQQRHVRADVLQQDVQRARAALAAAIARDPLADADAPTYAVFRQRHLDLQHHMEQMIGPLREHVRQALARASTPLRQLAALDATLEPVVAPREQALLPVAAQLLERRWQQLRDEHRQASEAAGSLEDDPARWLEPGGWLAAFVQDWRQALLAELDLRLEPVTGLVEALAHASRNSQ